jgi:translation initiation factor IF-2
MLKDTPQPANMEARPPIVAVMGHIDHGKSSLLDFIRKTNTTDREAGGITQRMSAYKVLHNGLSITFLDTPGHEAFKELRSRGAKVADIAILVVAADEGVKPQTVEAIRQIREASLPFIVALNKIDKPNANVDRVKQMLAENEVFLEGWGGDVPFVPVSAISGVGIPALLDMILLVAEITELKASNTEAAEGIVIEAQNSKQKGVGATLIIKNGILKAGEFVVAGEAIAPTRIFEDFQGKSIKEASLSDPVRIIGFDRLPLVGITFNGVSNKKAAEALAIANAQSMSKSEMLADIGPENPALTIPIVIKASSTDVIEAILHEIRKIKNERVGLKIIGNWIHYRKRRKARHHKTRQHYPRL